MSRGTPVGEHNKDREVVSVVEQSMRLVAEDVR